MNRRCMATAAVAALVTLAALPGCAPLHTKSAQVLPRVRHVFIIMLENQDYKDTFGASAQDPYLMSTLRPMGALLHEYYATGHLSLDNYIAMISGQAATLQTEADCERYNDFKLIGMSRDGQAIGDGCVYPASVQTLPDQLERAGLSWKGYMEDMGNDPARESASCGHPALNAVDRTQEPQAPSAAVPSADQYATRHNPFVYFHSIIDSPRCARQVVNLDHLTADLAQVASTPNLVFVTPNLCHDGHDGDGSGAVGKGCVNGEPGGLRSADEFLKSWVPRILASPAYQQDGLLIITFDESNAASVTTGIDSASGRKMTLATYAGVACCNQQPGPNVKRPAIIDYPVNEQEFYRIELAGVGGDRIGAVLLSPFIKPGTTSDLPYNHYALLRSVEDLFGLGHLGFAGQPGLAAFGADVYTHPLR
jgi:phosphatidylinositol-3-phosphatase